VAALALALHALVSPHPIAGGQSAALPTSTLKFGVFTARFLPDGTFTLEGDRWPSLTGTWKTDAGSIELTTTDAPKGCTGPGKYRYRVDGTHLAFDVVSDDCVPRRMILDRSAWRPDAEPASVPERRIVRTRADRPALLRAAVAAAGSWPSFRGPQA
jgi:hypothetical protein